MKMKVLLVNGSPHQNGCTNAALEIIAEELKTQGVESEIFWIGTNAVRGCSGCGQCRISGEGCIFKDDILPVLAQKAKEADGYIFGSPVHYASAGGAITSLMDRLFFSESKYLQYKPAAVVVSARRAGTTAAYDQLNKYLGINNMIIIPSPYWNMVHGSKAEEVYQDKEGVSIMRHLASSMVWMLKLLQEGEKAGLVRPVAIPMEKTNFIRE